MSETWVKPQNELSGAGKPEPGYCPLILSDKEMQVAGWTIRAAVEGGFESVDNGWRWWAQMVGGPCSSPGNSPDCALGLTP